MVIFHILMLVYQGDLRPMTGVLNNYSMDVNDGTKTVDPRKSRFLFEFGSSSVIG